MRWLWDVAGIRRQVGAFWSILCNFFIIFSDAPDTSLRSSPVSVMSTKSEPAAFTQRRDVSGTRDDPRPAQLQPPPKGRGLAVRNAAKSTGGAAGDFLAPKAPRGWNASSTKSANDAFTSSANGTAATAFNSHVTPQATSSNSHTSNNAAPFVLNSTAQQAPVTAAMTSSSGNSSSGGSFRPIRFSSPPAAAQNHVTSHGHVMTSAATTNGFGAPHYLSNGGGGAWQQPAGDVTATQGYCDL